MITTDLRKHPRIKSRVIVDKLGPTLDISGGGLRVLTANPQPEGAEVRLAFLLPESDDAVQCHGHVIHVARSPIDDDLFEMGIRYQRMMTRSREDLEAYIAVRASPDELD
jgi:PilZ domain-containing protein